MHRYYVGLCRPDTLMSSGGSGKPFSPDYTPAWHASYVVAAGTAAEAAELLNVAVTRSTYNAAGSHLSAAGFPPMRDNVANRRIPTSPIFDYRDDGQKTYSTTAESLARCCTARFLGAPGAPADALFAAVMYWGPDVTWPVQPRPAAYAVDVNGVTTTHIIPPLVAAGTARDADSRLSQLRLFTAEEVLDFGPAFFDAVALGDVFNQ